ncbi:ABC transporter ATP-binding protein [Halogeometricum borinquense]|uniref:ABC transporter ATP-binding protein n=1 Tax=Halogeometricum borinquense TaxID=60847 RepID=A0A6C0UNY8_9EURY|nr:ABC transporter ATP-binding protein [Halogeometricum borinquense]QIB76293.1 ABC transporter ATP-binding protein [Halogeometricum borinquense]QIQ75273.1 ABC transporter ATP-binding protein [Halogeometricum borinquense]
MAAIELERVTKRFEEGGRVSHLLDSVRGADGSKGVTAVRDLSLTVEEGEVFGFLGPNGAGKSTTINMLLDFVRPTEGTISVLGFDANDQSVDVRARTGVLPEGFDVYERLTGREHVEFAASSKGVEMAAEATTESGAETMESEESVGEEKVDAVLDRVGLAAAADRKAGGYSKGMRQRLALAMALIGDPDLLILDEPSSGLDPAGAKEMRDIVVEEAERGTTVFFSSHILEQVEAVCDRVGILRDGELVAVDTIDSLREKSNADSTLNVRVAGDVTTVDTDAVTALDGVHSVTVEDGDDKLIVSCAGDAKTAVIAELESQGLGVADFETREASLEDLFLSYTGHETDGDEDSTVDETNTEQEVSA